MFSENKKISGRQMFRLLTYDLIGIGTLLLPTILARTTDVNGIFALMIGLAVGCVYLKMIQTLLKKVKVDFYSFLKETCGVVLEKVILVFFLIYFLLLAGFGAYLFASLVLRNLLQQGSYLQVLILLLLVAGYGTVAGIEGRARIYEMLFWFLMIPLFAMLLLGAKDVETAYWTPVMMGSWSSFMKGSYVVLIWASLLFLLLFLEPYVKNPKLLAKNGRRAFLFAGGFNFVLFLILLGNFGGKALAQMDYPVVTLMSTVQISGGFLKRVDALMFGVWFFTLYALLNSMLFYGSQSLKEIFKEPVSKIKTMVKQSAVREQEGQAQIESRQKEIQQNGKQQNRVKMQGDWQGWYTIIVMIITFAIAVIFYRDSRMKEIYEWLIWWIGTPVLLVLPLILLGIAKGKEAWQHGGKG